MDTTADTDDDILASADRLVPPLEKGQWAFRLALLVAFLLHAALFIEIGRSPPPSQRSIGDPTGAKDAIAVEIVTEADLKSREAVAMPPVGAPTPTATPQQPAPEPEPAPEPVEKTPDPTPVEPKQQPEAAEPAPQKEAPAEKAPEQKKITEPPDFEAVLRDLAAAPQPTDPAQPAPETPPVPEAKQKPTKSAEKQEAEPAKKKKPAQKQARLDPSPKDLQNAPPGRSAGATRPPGITQSGENDAFGREVIRALRQTMPPPRGIFGRVTVRMILTPNGDLAEIQILEASGTSLDQNVVFAAKQTYFPLPPYNATLADRTFTVRYIYR